MPRRSGAQRARIRSEALLVRRVAYGEADLVVTLLSRERGLVSAVARSARKSARRFAALEPMHLLRVALDERPGAELGSLVETEIVRPRRALTANLERLEAAGRALRWVRRVSPPHTPEPAIWAEANALLDALDAPELAAPPERLLAASGLRLLGQLGWGLELERCVGCGKTCAPAASAYVDPTRGGLVCRACGGGRILLGAEPRGRLAAVAAGRAGAGSLSAEDAAMALDLAEAALFAHAGVVE